MIEPAGRGEGGLVALLTLALASAAAAVPVQAREPRPESPGATLDAESVRLGSLVDSELMAQLKNINIYRLNQYS